MGFELSFAVVTKDSKCDFGHDMENRSSVEITFHIAAKMGFGQVKKLVDAAILSWTGQILKPWW